VADYLRTGSLGLDIVLGGGWKPGTINEIWGEPGSGKTTLAEHAIWELPSGKKALWMSLGTEIPHRPTGALLAQPRNAEQAFVIMQTCVIGDVDLIVVDSANGLVRQRELDGDPDYVPHPQREYKDELNRLKEYARDARAIVIFLSKPRDRDRQPIRGTGISEKAKDRVQLRVWQEHQDGSREIQFRTKTGETEGVFSMNPGTGIDWAGELARLSVQYELVHQRGAWYEVNYERVLGIKQLAEFIADNTRLAVDLDAQIRAKAGI
jgi:recombination protein RecA